MPHRHDAPAPEFSRLAAAPKQGASIAFSETARAPEREALARRYGVEAVDAFSVKARLTGTAGGVLVEGVVSARMTQRCVVTLEPVETRLQEAFERRFAPAAQIAQEDAFDPEAEDPPEPLTDEIDVGEIAAETAALAIDPYPRAPGADLERASAAPPGAAPLDDEALRPFSGLAALKRRLEGKDDGGE